MIASLSLSFFAIKWVLRSKAMLLLDQAFCVPSEKTWAEELGVVKANTNAEVVHSGKEELRPSLRNIGTWGMYPLTPVSKDTNCSQLLAWVLSYTGRCTGSPNVCISRHKRFAAWAAWSAVRLGLHVSARAHRWLVALAAAGVRGRWAKMISGGT